jgi:hypothetical protein
VGLAAEAGVRVDGVALEEYAADGVEGLLAVRFANGVEIVDHRAVELSFQEVVASMIARQRQ